MSPSILERFSGTGSSGWPWRQTCPSGLEDDFLVQQPKFLLGRAETARDLPRRLLELRRNLCNRLFEQPVPLECRKGQGGHSGAQDRQNTLHFRLQISLLRRGRRLWLPADALTFRVQAPVFGSVPRLVAA